MKPVIYGSYTGKTLGVKKCVNAISGLGYNFTENRRGIVQKVMLRFLKYGLKRNHVSIIFQNDDDHFQLQNLGIIDSSNSIFKIKGSGVNLGQFYPTPFPDFQKIKILFPVRMLWDKGVRELREASELLKPKYQNRIQFILSGIADEDNKAGVTADYLNDWQDGNYVKWIGYQKDMVSIYSDSHIVVLPSYREGMPKTLIEACAMGRPIVTTNAIGCRECVDEGINGFKVNVRSSENLVKALETLIINPDLIKSMGQKSRIKAEKEFNVNNVIQKHLEIYSN